MDDVFIVRMFDFVALPGIGVDNTIRLFKCPCFACRVMDDVFIVRMFEFVASFGIKDSIQLFTSPYFTFRVDKQYLDSFFSLVDACGDDSLGHQTIKVLYTSKKTTAFPCFAVLAMDQDFISKVIRFISFAIGQGVTLRCHVQHNLSALVVNAAQPLQQSDSFLEDVTWLANNISWPDTKIFVTRHAKDISVLRQSGFFVFYMDETLKLWRRALWALWDVNKLLRCQRNNAGLIPEATIRTQLQEAITSYNTRYPKTPCPNNAYL
jgi:hypothetical protein